MNIAANMHLNGLQTSKIIYFLLIIVFLIGFFLRIYKIETLPPGFFADEASIGFNAYTLLTKGSDEVGNKLPILFNNFGNFFRPGLSIYITAPLVALFGLNEFSVRLGAATVGSFSIILIYFVAKLLYNHKVALLASIILATSSWHFHMSRIGQEFIYLPFFVLLSLTFFLLGIKNNKGYVLLFSFFAFGLSLYSYVTAYFVIPLILLATIFIYKKQLLKMHKFFYTGLLITFLLSLPLLHGIPEGKTFSRFTQISTENNQKTNQEILTGVMRTYLDHFSPSFLFLDGDIGYAGHFITRFSVRGMGQLYLYQLPFIIAGLVFIIRHFNKSSAMVVSLTAIYPLGSTLAPFADGGGPFAMRSILGVIPLTILTSLGLYYLINKIPSIYIKLILNIIVFLIVGLSFFVFLKKYYNDYPRYASDFWGWQYGARGIMETFLKNKNSYDELYIEGKFNAPEIHIKFYDPENKCQSKCKIGSMSEFDSSKKQLFAISSDSLPSVTKKYDFYLIKELVDPTGNPAFFIGELKNKDNKN